MSKDIPDNCVAAGNPVKVIGTYDEYVEKHRMRMNERPVYNKIWTEKTSEEKQAMKQELIDGIGYDL